MLRSMMVVSLAGLMSLTCLSQTSSTPQTADNSTPKKFYQLNFLVQELENDRVINSRSYTTIMRNSGDQAFIRAGAKLPVTSSTGATTQWQQIDVGVNIDCQRLEDMGNGVSLHIKAEISRVMESAGENNSSPALPIIRQNQWESSIALPLKQPTILFSSDDPVSKRRMQLQLTAAPIR